MARSAHEGIMGNQSRSDETYSSKERTPEHNAKGGYEEVGNAVHEQFVDKQVRCCTTISQRLTTSSFWDKNRLKKRGKLARTKWTT